MPIPRPLPILALFVLQMPPSLAAKNGCDAALGDWNWFTGGVVSIGADKVLKYNGAAIGTWECTDPEHQTLTLTWKPTGLVDVLTLAADGQSLAGKNQKGVAVSGHRVGATDVRANGNGAKGSGTNDGWSKIGWKYGHTSSSRAKGIPPKQHKPPSQP